MTTMLMVSGMTCNHCKMSVTDALKKLSGVSRVEVDLQTKQVTVEHDPDVDRASMAQAVEAVGFDVG